MWGIIYLLHFAQPISLKHTCQHYLGWALDLERRLVEHRAGRGARLTAVAVERGIGFEVVRTWPGDRTLERRLKNRKESPRLCPVCFPVQRRRAAIDAIQLELPLEDDPFPAPLKLPLDWYEISYYRSQRAARPIWAPLTDNLDDGLL